MIKIIVILCNSFEEAQDGYDIFVSFLEKYEPWSIRNTFNASYCVETDDDLRYIFVDHRLKSSFYTFDRPDEIWLEDFFEGIDEYYFGNVGLEAEK